MATRSIVRKDEMAKGKRYVNPFKPTAGMTPPILVGRESVIDDFTEALDEGPGAPGRLMRITGPRGSGKTVLLTELGNLAADSGWTVVNVSGKEQICPSIQEQLSKDKHLASLDLKISAPFLTAEAKTDKVQSQLSFREAFAKATRGLTHSNRGLLITVDEAQDVSRDEMTALATNVQYMIREQQNIGLLFAGITTGVLDLLNGEGMTFLRRARAEELGSIPEGEVAAALNQSIEASGLSVDACALELAAQATHGYAYLIQLVGYNVWREGRRHAGDSPCITEDDAQRGIAVAIAQYGESVLETALAGLAEPAMNYLLAMTEDEGASSTAVIAARIGKPPASANTYRRLLIARQIIESTAPGYVAFSLPFMREYLVEHKAELLARYGA